MQFPTSMKPVSFWSGPFQWRRVAGKTSATTSCADMFYQTVEDWRSAAPTCGFCLAGLASRTPRWWWLTSSRTPTTASCWRLSMGCLSWPKTMQSSMWHLMWQPIRQVCCTSFLITWHCQTLHVQFTFQFVWYNRFFHTLLVIERTLAMIIPFSCRIEHYYLLPTIF